MWRDFRGAKYVGQRGGPVYRVVCTYWGRRQFNPRGICVVQCSACGMQTCLKIATGHRARARAARVPSRMRAHV